MFGCMQSKGSVADRQRRGMPEGGNKQEEEKTKTKKASVDKVDRIYCNIKVSIAGKKGDFRQGCVF